MFSGFCLISLCLPQGHENIHTMFSSKTYRFNSYNRSIYLLESVSVYILHIGMGRIRLMFFLCIYQTFPYYLLKKLPFPLNCCGTSIENLLNWLYGYKLGIQFNWVYIYLELSESFYDDASQLLDCCSSILTFESGSAIYSSF